MKTAIADASRLVASVKGLVPWTNDLLTRNETHITADLLHRTTQGYALPEWPEGLDHWALEQRARRMRADHIAGLAIRCAEALARWLGGATRAMRGRSAAHPQGIAGEQSARGMS